MRTSHMQMLVAVCAATVAGAAFAETHTVEAATDGRMLNLRTVYPSVGDTVTLPAAADGCSYVVGNTNIAEMVSDNVMKILAPGATSVAYYTGGSVATWNDCAEVVVPPTPKGSGSVYVWTRTANDGSGNWADAANWTLARGTENASGYPNAIDDVAMCFVNGQRKWMQITVNADVTVGALWTGSVRHQYNSGDFVARFAGPNTITFRASDGTAALNILGSSTDSKFHRHHFGRTTRLPIVLASSLTVDLGYASGDRTSSSRDFVIFDQVDMTLPTDYSVVFQNVNPGNFGSATHTVDMTDNFKITGGGTMVNDSAATVSKLGDWSAFSGAYVEQGCGHHGYHSGNNNANTYQTSIPNSLAKMVVRGFPQNATTQGGGTFRGNLTSWGNFAGFLRIAGGAASNPGNRLGYAEVDMEGGFIDIRCDAVADWADPMLVNAPGKLVAKEGFSGIHLNALATETYPTNVLSVADLSNANGAMLAIREPMSDARSNTVDGVRGWVTVGNFSDNAIGGDGSVVDGDRDYKVIPWLVSPRVYDGGYSQFFGVNDDGVLVTATNRLACSISAVEGDTDNVAMEGSGHSLESATDRKINSLFLRNVGGASHWVGKDRRLEITSGGIILSFYGLIGHIGDSGEVEGSQAGEVYLPNRGYIWGVNSEEQTKSGQIWDKLIAPNGVSFAAVNHASAQITLGGNQTGIEKDITVNVGKLVLGNDEVGCTLRSGLELRVVGATSFVEVPAVSRTSLKNVNVVLRDVAGYPAKISVPDADTCVTIKNLVAIDDDGNEVEFRPGVYAAAAGDGVDYVDEHIVGDGKVRVLERGMFVILM